jgi:hypothetical protein
MEPTVAVDDGSTLARMKKSRMGNFKHGGRIAAGCDDGIVVGSVLMIRWYDDDGMLMMVW